MMRSRTISIVAALAALIAFVPIPEAPAKKPARVTCKAGVAGMFPCKRIDLQAFIPISDLAIGLSDVWGWVDPETKHEYALVGSTRGLLFVDVTKPTAPTYLGRLLPKVENPLLWQGQDVEVYKDHAYVVCDLFPCLLQIFDLTRLRGVAEPQDWTPDLVYPIPIVHTLDINPETGFLYLNGSDATDGAPHIVDINEPMRPVPAGFTADDGYTHDSLCRIYKGPDKNFRGREMCFNFNFNIDTITIYEMSNKLVPVQVGRVTYEGASVVHSGALTNDHRYLISTDEGDERASGFPSTLYIWDVAKPAKPKLISTYRAKFNAIDHNVFVKGDLIYHASYAAGLRVLDTSKIAQGKLKEIAYFDVVPETDDAIFDGSWSVYPYLPSGNVLVTGVGQGLFIVDPQFD